ncbi:MAG: MFS transporter [Burkholderiales bacterium]|nr:MFS transporter [Burkholderiales bacterium]
MAEASPPRASPLRALAHRNFRLYFAGQGVSILGTWIQTVALSWLVYRLTGSAALLGIVAFLGQAPQLVVGPLAGAWIDRHDRRRMLMAVQGLLAAQALVLSMLTFAGLVGPRVIVAMALLLGLANSFETPLRQALLGQLVGTRADLGNAIALNAMLFNSARFVGPPVAGILVAAFGEAVCFALNAVSFLALIGALAAVRVTASPRAPGSIGSAFREGIAYAWGSYPTRVLLAMVAFLNLLATPYVVLMPIFAERVFGGDARTLGWLLGAAGVGSVGAAAFLATRRSHATLIGYVALGCGVAAASLAVVSHTERLALALGALAAAGFGMTATNVSCNTTLQTIVPERLRGRVVSLFTSALWGMHAVGGLAAGAVASAAGAGATLAGGAGLLAAVTAWYVTRLPALRRALAGAAPAAP